MSVLHDFEEKEYSFLEFVKKIILEPKSTFEYINSFKFNGFVKLIAGLHLIGFVLGHINIYYFIDSISDLFLYLTWLDLLSFTLLFIIIVPTLILILRYQKVQFTVSELVRILIYSSIPFLLFKLCGVFFDFVSIILNVSASFFFKESNLLNLGIILWSIYLVYTAFKDRVVNKETFGVMLCLTSVLSFGLVLLILTKTDLLHAVF